MAIGGEGNQSQIQLGYGGCIRGTGRVTACPPGSGATQRSSAAGIVSDQDGSHGEEDVTQSPVGQRGQAEDEIEVVIRSQWQQGEGVTQLAVHSTADGKRSDALHGDFCEEGTGAVAQSLPQF